jgi:hypothetical protein
LKGKSKYNLQKKDPDLPSGLDSFFSGRRKSREQRNMSHPEFMAHK